MENIAAHTERLLTRHECVIVPGLGGFLSYRESATVKGLQLQAPHRSIRFNALLSYQDGLLAEAVMQSENVGYKAALAIIEREVRAIKETLDGNRTVQFGRLGRFSSDGDNAILFTSDSCAFLPENIGCQPVYLKRLSPLTEQPGARRDIVIQLPAQGGRAWRYAAAVALIFTLSLLVPTKIEKGTLRASMPSIVMEETCATALPSPAPTDAVTLTDMPQAQTAPMQAHPAATDKEKETSATDEPQHTTGKYHLIVASLPSRELAETYISEQTSFPASTLHIIECDDKYRISAASFATRREALHHLDSIRGTHSAWILCR